MAESRCSVCHGPVAFWRQKGDYRIYHCGRCGHGQVLPVLSLGKVREIYRDSGHDSEARTPESVTLETVLRGEASYPNTTIDAARFARNAVRFSGPGRRSVLDVGAGYGLFSRAFLDAGFEVNAIENAANEAAVFRALNGFAPHAGLFEDFSSNTTYSHVLMSHVLEHVTDPDAWLSKANTLLDPGGVLMIALPNFGSIFRRVMQEREPYIIPPYHLNYFTARSMTMLLERHGFGVLRQHTVSRLPFGKIFGRMGVPRTLLPALTGLGHLALSAMDVARAGSVLNVYAGKRR